MARIMPILEGPQSPDPYRSFNQKGSLFSGICILTNRHSHVMVLFEVAETFRPKRTLSESEAAVEGQFCKYASITMHTCPGGRCQGKPHLRSARSNFLKKFQLVLCQNQCSMKRMVWTMYMKTSEILGGFPKFKPACSSCEFMGLLLAFQLESQWGWGSRWVE